RCRLTHALPSFPTRRSSDLDDVFAQVMQIACGDRMGCDPALQAVAPADAVAGERQIIPEIIMQMREKRAAAYIGEEANAGFRHRSEEHTSELQSRENLVCRL